MLVSTEKLHRGVCQKHTLNTVNSDRNVSLFTKCTFKSLGQRRKSETRSTTLFIYIMKAATIPTASKTVPGAIDPAPEVPSPEVPLPPVPLPLPVVASSGPS
jgi:hypothetical protein